MPRWNSDQSKPSAKGDIAALDYPGLFRGAGDAADRHTAPEDAGPCMFQTACIVIRPILDATWGGDVIDAIAILKTPAPFDLSQCQSSTPGTGKIHGAPRSEEKAHACCNILVDDCHCIDGSGGCGCC